MAARLKKYLIRTLWEPSAIPYDDLLQQRYDRFRRIGEFTEAGWHFVAESYALPYQYYLVFLPPGEPEKPAFLDR